MTEEAASAAESMQQQLTSTRRECVRALTLTDETNLIPYTGLSPGAGDLKFELLRKGQLLVKLGPYHAEPHEAEATPKANNVRTETPYPYLPPRLSW